jgi:hypothetical protein
MESPKRVQLPAEAHEVNFNLSFNGLSDQASHSSKPFSQPIARLRANAVSTRTHVRRIDDYAR